MDGLLKGLRAAARSLARQPGSALVSTLILALGIGLSTFMFSLVYSVLYRGLDVPESDRLAVVGRVDTKQGPPEVQAGPVSGQDFADFRERTRSFEGMIAYRTLNANLVDDVPAQRYVGLWATANAFDVLRVQPLLGRTFLPGEDAPGLPPTIVLGYHVWRDRYGSDPDILGRSVRLNGRQGTVVGVMPEGFRWPSSHDLWVAMDDDFRAVPRAPEGGRFYAVMARLADGVSWNQADLEVGRVAAQIESELPDVNRGITARLVTVNEQQNGGPIRVIFLTMMVAVICVLLVACANVANLLLARAAVRMREAGVRVALGAGRLRVVLPFFAEAVVLAGVGAVIGTGLAFWAVGLFDQATDPALTGRPYWVTFTVDLPVLLFTVAVTGLTALVAGSAPAYQVSRADVNEILKDEGRGSSSLRVGRMGKVLVIVEVAFSVALLVCAGLMTRSMIELQRFQLPFDPTPLTAGQLTLFDTEYPTRGERQAFWTELEERASAVPGVEAVALTQGIPGAGSGAPRIRLEGQIYADANDRPVVHSAQVTPGYFDLLGATLLEGRGLDASDTRDVELVAVVNRSFARRFWPDGSALGHRFRTGAADTIPWMTVVGVVEDLQMQGFQPAGQPSSVPDGYYAPIAQYDPTNLSLVVRAAPGVSTASLTSGLRDAVRAIDPDLPLAEVRSVPETLERQSWFYRVFGTVFIVFGIVAVFMASVGLYSVLTFTVSRRTQEVGIRMALGAGRRDVVRLILRQGLFNIGVGLVVGLAMAAGVSRVITVFLFGVTPRDPLVFGVVVVLIVLVGLLACLVPVRRATAVDPIVALRAE